MADVGTVNGSTLSLACGTLALGLAECAMMAVLPECARAQGVSIPQAGLYISAYALGVCLGAPVISLCTGAWPLKRLLLMLALMIFWGNLATAFSVSHGMMLAMRFVSGLPHGAFFGVGSIVAERMAARGKEARTVGVMLMGISASNVIGVPVAAWLAHAYGWSWSFVLTAAWGLLTLVMVGLYIPAMPPLPGGRGRSQFFFLSKPAPWFLLAVTFLANNGYFCLYSYVKPYLTDSSGISPGGVGWVLLAAGCGMCLGNFACAKGADRYTPGRVAMAALLAMAAALLGAFCWGGSPAAAVFCIVVISFCVFGVGLCWQVMILRYARGGEMIGVAAIQVAFNAGNAFGAWCGGIPIDRGYSPRYAAIPGVASVLAGVLLLYWFLRLYESRRLGGIVRRGVAQDAVRPLRRNGNDEKLDSMRGNTESH